VTKKTEARVRCFICVMLSAIMFMVAWDLVMPEWGARGWAATGRAIGAWIITFFAADMYAARKAE